VHDTESNMDSTRSQMGSIMGDNGEDNSAYNDLGPMFAFDPPELDSDFNSVTNGHFSTLAHDGSGTGHLETGELYSEDDEWVDEDEV
jgi:hypothetical protein